MFDSIFNSTNADATITVTNLLISIVTALLLGAMISVVNMKTQKENPPSQSFNLTLVILPAIVAMIILLVGSNIARAFSLAGAFSIIRFRSVAGGPKDITYVLFSLAVGLASGMGYIGYAALMAAILCLVVILLETFKFGRSSATSKTLKITIPEDLDYEDAFEGVLKRYTLHYHLSMVKTTNLGSLYQLIYNVTIKENIKEKDLIDELRCRNGNLNISLIMSPQTKEY